MAENIGKAQFRKKSQTEGHKHNICLKIGVEYVDWAHLTEGLSKSGDVKYSVCRKINETFQSL